MFSIGRDHSDSYSGLECAVFEKMSKCFRKVWRKQKEEEAWCSRKQIHLLRTLYAFKKKGKAQRAIIGKYISKLHFLVAEKIAARKKRRVEDTVSRLTENEKFSPSEFWKLKRKLCPKATLERTSIILENCNEVCGENAIREA